MSEWISVEDKLPDEWQRVIVCNINGEFNDWSNPISEAIFAPCGKGAVNLNLKQRVWST